MADRPIPPPDQRLNYSAYSADDLHAILVADAVAHYATDLPWFVAAIQRIAQLRRRSPEQAMIDLLDDVEAQTGHRKMPMHSGVIL